MKALPHLYRFVFAERLAADEVIEVAGSSAHSAMGRAGPDHGTVVFDFGSVARLEIHPSGLAATLTSKQKPSREVCEIIEEASHGHILLATDIKTGQPVHKINLPEASSILSEESQDRTRMRRRVTKKCRCKITDEEADVLLKIERLASAGKNVYTRQFRQEEHALLGELESIGAVAAEDRFVRLIC